MSFALVTVADSNIPDYKEINSITGKVRELINHTVKCNAISECEEFVRSVRYKHIILIVTPDMINEIFVQNIHQIRHVQSIFLFDPNVTMDSHCVYELRRLSYKVCIQFILTTL